jgi:hypothetical protein
MTSKKNAILYFFYYCVNYFLNLCDNLANCPVLTLHLLLHVSLTRSYQNSKRLRIEQLSFSQVSINRLSVWGGLI